MSRTPAGDRVRRLLALIPWLTANSPASIEEVCRRFGIDRRTLLDELDVLPYVGVPPYTPDTMIGVDVDDDVISVYLAEPFDRPLRLTPPQALALIAAGRSIREVPGADAGDPLQRALAKVANALGVDAERVHVDLGDAERSTLDQLNQAAAEHRRLEIGYFTYGRDAHSTRTIDPYRVYADGSNWYLLAWCHRSEDTRIFRVDRIDELRELDETFERPRDASAIAIYSPAADDPRVVLRLDRSARWVVEQYPYEALQELGDGAAEVTFAVSGRPWLERLLVRLGPAAEVVSADDTLDEAGPAAARRILARYAAG